MRERAERGVCTPCPDPTDVLRELQEIARSHPALVAKLDRASVLISRQSAFIIDNYRALIATRLVEHLE